MSQMSVIVNGVEWKCFACEFETQEGQFVFNLYAIDMPHAIDRLGELKATAKISGELHQVIPFQARS